MKSQSPKKNQSGNIGDGKLYAGVPYEIIYDRWGKKYELSEGKNTLRQTDGRVEKLYFKVDSSTEIRKIEGRSEWWKECRGSHGSGYTVWEQLEANKNSTGNIKVEKSDNRKKTQWMYFQMRKDS